MKESYGLVRDDLLRSSALNPVAESRSCHTPSRPDPCGPAESGRGSVLGTSLSWVLLLLCSSPSVAAPTEREERRKFGAMPEPVLGESITDIDGSEAGEVEVDLTALVGRTGGTNLWQGSIEIESRVTDHLGLELEIAYSGAFTSNLPERSTDLRLLASWSLLHDFDRGLHAQAEIAWRFVGEIEDGANLGEPRLPFSAGFRVGLDRGWWTLRLGLGAAAGRGGSAHLIPVWASTTAFLNFGRGRWASLGLDGEADWTRTNPFTVAPTLVFNGSVVHIPGKVAIVAPYGFPAGSREPWFGLMLRVIGEFDFGARD